MTEWTTVSRAEGIAEAELVRMRLEAGGVSAVVRDANVIRMDPILSNIMGGIRIEVPATQEELARELLGLSPIDHYSGASTAPRTCPFCGGADLVYASRNRAKRLATAILALLFVAAGVPRGLNRELRCKGCGEFVPDEPGAPATNDSESEGTG
jgi:hypothetical protein